MGDVSWLEGDSRTARELYGESLARSRAIGDREGTAVALMFLASVVPHEDDDRDSARTLFRESLELFRELGFRQRMASCLVGLAAVTADEDGPGAARLLGAAQALRDETGGEVEDWRERPLLEAAEARSRELTGDEAFTAAFASGRSAARHVVGEALAAEAARGVLGGSS